MKRPLPHPPAALPRRRLLAWIGGGMIAVLGAELAWIVAAFVRPRDRSRSAGAARIDVGTVDMFEPGTVTPFPGGRFYLARLEDGGFLALDRRCTHLGCSVPWDADRGCFACPCHGSTFDLTGAVLAPPATRPLDVYPVRIENGRVSVDVSRRAQRATFEPSQVARA